MAKQLKSSKPMITDKQKAIINKETIAPEPVKNTRKPTSFLLHKVDLNRLNKITLDINNLAVSSISKTQIIRSLIALGETTKRDKLLEVVKDNI